MKDLTNAQISRQDFVDNSIFDLLQALNPSKQQMEWDIEMIAEIRECIAQWFVEKARITDDTAFYPCIDE